MYKIVIVAAVLAILGVVSFMAYESHSERASRDAENLADAQRTLTYAHGASNLGQCYQHLGITLLTADSSPKWRAFKRAHHITSTPQIMSDEDLKACQSL